MRTAAKRSKKAREGGKAALAGPAGKKTAMRRARTFFKIWKGALSQREACDQGSSKDILTKRKGAVYGINPFPAEELPAFHLSGIDAGDF